MTPSVPNTANIHDARGELLGGFMRGHRLRVGTSPHDDLGLRVPVRLELRWELEADQPTISTTSGVYGGGLWVDGRPLEAPTALHDGSVIEAHGLILRVQLVRVPRARARRRPTPDEFPVQGVFLSTNELLTAMRKVEAETRTGTLRLEVDGRGATLVFIRGRVVGALHPPLVGLAALEKVVTAPCGAYRLASGVLPVLMEEPLDLSVSEFLQQRA